MKQLIAMILALSAASVHAADRVTERTWKLSDRKSVV